jgi:hypothetical protein
MLFGIAWAVVPFPCVEAQAAPRIPPVSGIVPKVFSPPWLDDEWALATFDQLGRRDWPLKTAVNLVWPMMIYTNPFEVARQFYRVIDEIGKCVQRIMIRRNEPTKFVEIDFDQIFALMIVCVLAAGIGAIVEVMAWSCAFREYAKEDPHVQYAMSHMEGLCSHLSRLE